MSRRFPLLVALLAVVVAGGAFAVGLQVLDDDEPDPPPRGAAGAEVPTGGATAPASPPTSAPATGRLATPAWIVVVASEGSEAAATARAHDASTRGQPVGVLRSDDYPSLNPGLWVAYAGPYANGEEATAARDALTAAGLPGTYVRCAGAGEQCGRTDDD